MRLHILCLAACLLAALSGCASTEDREDERLSARQYYLEGKKALEHEDYELAIQYFGDLEARYPFGRYADQGLLATAYAHYKQDDPEAAIATADRFIKLHPTHPDVDYAYYVKGLANFHSRDNFLDSIFNQDPSKRDPASARRSFQFFAELVRRYPQSRYAADARQRLIFLRNELANYELHVADYYLRRGAYVAAADRATYLIEHYARTPAVTPAVALLANAYRKLGLEDLASDAERIHALNTATAEKPLAMTEHRPPTREPTTPN